MSNPPTSQPNKKKICFDYSHKNKLRLEDTPYNLLMDFLVESGFLLAKSELGFLNPNYLKQFDCLVIGNMTESYFEIEEIQNIVTFVKDGGSVLLISDEGGDFDNHNNISELGSQFGISFNPDRLFDATNSVDKQDFIAIKDFRQHFITRGIDSIIHSSGCSLTVTEQKNAKDIIVDALAFASESARHKVYNGMDWVEEPCPKVPILAVTKYYNGKVGAIGNVSIFSSLGASYGLKVESNKILVGNLFSWLLNQTPPEGGTLEEGILVSINIEASNYNWVMDQIKDKTWPNLSAALNLAIQNLRTSVQQKDNKKPMLITTPEDAPQPDSKNVEEITQSESENEEDALEPEIEAEEDTPKTESEKPEQAPPKPHAAAKKSVHKKGSKRPPGKKPLRNPLS